jgi:hypothetical protein
LEKYWVNKLCLKPEAVLEMPLSLYQLHETFMAFYQAEILLIIC